MKRPLLEREIMRFIKNKPEYIWFKKVSLYPYFEDYSPETVGRALRSLQEKGKLEVGYYDGKYSKGLAKYKLK
jgi:DNA-binding transcriptional ArsR family regulator